MELITVCGLVIVAYCLWVEFELAAQAVVKMVRTSRFLKEDFSGTSWRHPVSMGRLPVCLAKLSHYRDSA
jgi:hypothetical protein